jgi:hypothetical protein
MHTLASELLSDRFGTFADKVPVPSATTFVTATFGLYNKNSRSSSVDSGRERRHVIRKPHSHWAVLQAQARPSNIRLWADIPLTPSNFPAKAGSNIHLLNEREVRYKRVCEGVRLCPCAMSVCGLVRLGAGLGKEVGDDKR